MHKTDLHSVLENALDGLAGSRQELNEQLGKIITKALNYVLDGESSLDDLEAVVKTFIGTKIEKIFLNHFNLPANTTLTKKARKDRGEKCLDTVLGGIALDLKFTCRNTWMIPPEAVGEWCLLIQADFDNSRFSYGVFQARPEWLTSPKGNRDGKRSVSAEGKKFIHWLGQNVPLGADTSFATWSLEHDFRRIAASLGTMLGASPKRGFDDLPNVPNAPGVYALWHDAVLVYVGKAVATGGLKARLANHRTKLDEATRISTPDMRFQFLLCDPHLATGLEGYLIAEHQAPWNGSGFGSKVAGKGRPNQKTAAWDIEYGRGSPAS